MENENITPTEGTGMDTPSNTNPPQGAEQDPYSRYSKLYGDDSASSTTDQALPESRGYTQDDINRALYEEILALKSVVEKLRENQPPQTPPAQQPGPTTETVSNPKLVWLEKLRDGKFEEGTDALVKTVINQLESSGYINALQSLAATQSLEAVRAESELMKYVDSIKAAKPHLAEMEDLITARVKSTMLDAYNSGAIGSISDWVKTFKSVLDKEVERADSIYRKIRSSGTPDPAQIKQKVASGAVVVPTPGQREAASPTYSPQGVADYIAERKAAQLARSRFNTETK